MTDAADANVAERIRARLAHVQARLAYEIDVVAARAAQEHGAVIIDTRKRDSWDHGHVTGALHLPASALDGDLGGLPTDRALIVYGWGPGCNGATSTAKALLERGYDVHEMVGGFEYWVRNGFPVEGVEAAGTTVDLTGEPDPLVTAE